MFIYITDVVSFFYTKLVFVLGWVFRVSQTFLVCMCTGRRTVELVSVFCFFGLTNFRVVDSLCCVRCSAWLAATLSGRKARILEISAKNRAVFVSSACSYAAARYSVAF